VNGRPEPVGGLAPDVVLAAYLLVTAVMALASGGATGLELGLVHGAGAGAVALLARRPLPRRPVPRFVRIAYPILLMPVLYGELRILDQLLFRGFFDPAVQGWEQALFGTQLSVAAAQALPFAWLSVFLHLGYVSYYFVVPVALIAVFVSGGAAALERAVTTIALAFFVCYLFFAVFPVAGPRYLFPPLAGPPGRGEVYTFVHSLLDRGSSKGTAFPSSHVAASVSALLVTWRDGRRAFGWLLVPVTALVVGTVYGRFHYGVDALAGLAVAAAAFAATPWLVARVGRDV
jgi:membrane-associated phospholipid phosphatase